MTQNTLQIVIGGEDVTTFALRPRARGEVTVVDEIVEQAAPDAFFDNPQNERTQLFLSQILH